MKALLAVVLTTIGSVAYAGVWTGKMQITNLYIQTTYDGVFINQPTMSTDASIMQCNRDMYFLPRTHVFFREIYSMLLSARATGKSINVYLDPCTTGVGGFRPLVSFIQDAD